MNKLCLNLFTILFPFYPIWAWLFYTATGKPIDVFAGILLLPLALYFVTYVNKKLPNYLLCFILFTVYHLASAVINNTIPESSNKLYFFLTDYNVLACLFFIVVEYTEFDEEFINRMNKAILLIVLLSVVVSLIQTKNINFFFNAGIDPDGVYIGEDRISSIYSWTNLNTVGITFPILVSILLSVYETRIAVLPLPIISGIIVSFLTKGRYVMISTIIAFSQLLFSGNISIVKKMFFVFAFIGSLLLVGVVAGKVGYDITEVIDQRILEKESDFASAKARVLSYDVFWMVFPENPVLGVGPATKQKVVDLLQGEAPLIHVGYLSYLYFYGIVGCLILWIALFLLLRDAWIVGKQNHFWGSFYGLIAFCFANSTMVYFNFSEMGIVLAVIYIKYCKSLNAMEPAHNEPNDDERILMNDLPVAYD